MKAKVLLLVILLSGMLLAGCSQQQEHGEGDGLSGTLTIAGSTTVLPINQECTRLFQEKHPDVRISVTGGGSGHGIRAAASGEIDIGAASRDLKTEEKEQYPDLKVYDIGKDCVAVIVHPSNSVSNLTLEQVSKIFSGEISNWNEVGGFDSKIHVVTREYGSGTREVFEKYVMKPYNNTIHAKLTKPSNGEVKATVAGSKVAIGYISLGYVDKSVKALAIDGVEPTEANVVSDDYPIVRTLHLMTKGEPSHLEEAFLDFARSEEGQEVVEQQGYIKMPSKT